MMEYYLQQGVLWLIEVLVKIYMQLDGSGGFMSPPWRLIAACMGWTAHG